MIVCVFLIVLFAIAAKCASDYYSIFGMTRQNFNPSKLKKAYFELAKQYHPDKNPDPAAAEKLISITQAYETLSDKKKKDIYDRYGEEGLKSGAHGAGGFHPEDIFEQFFGKGFKVNFGGFGGFQHHTPRTPDSRVELKVALEDAFKGADLSVGLNRQKKCSACNGVGAEKPDDIVRCKDCNGSGLKVFIRNFGMGMVQQVQTTCDKCGGHGKVFKSVCGKCQGHKVVRADEILNIKIKAGCPDNFVIVFKGGADESPGMETGDLHVTIRSEQHPSYRRDGQNLFTELSIGLQDALLGFNKTIMHMDGHSVPIIRDTVTQPSIPFLFLIYFLDQMLTISEEGMPDHDDIPAGNLYVNIRVVLPEKLTETQRAFFGKKEFGWKDEL